MLLLAIGSLSMGQTMPPGTGDGTVPDGYECLFDKGNASCDTSFGLFEDEEANGVPCPLMMCLWDLPSLDFRCLFETNKNISVDFYEWYSGHAKTRLASNNEFVVGYVGTMKEFICRQNITCNKCNFTPNRDAILCNEFTVVSKQSFNVAEYLRNPTNLLRLTCPPKLE